MTLHESSLRIILRDNFKGGFFMSEKMLVTQALDERDLLVKKISDKIDKASFVDTIHSCKHWLDGACDGHLCAESEIPELVMDDNYNIIDGCMLEIFLNIGGDIHKKIEIGNTGKVLPFS